MAPASVSFGQDFSQFDLQKMAGRFRDGFTYRSQSGCYFVVSAAP
jgi:hypothetical protein